MYIKTKFVKCTLQNIEKLHFFVNLFGHIKNLCYLCSRFQKQT